MDAGRFGNRTTLPSGCMKNLSLSPRFNPRCSRMNFGIVACPLLVIADSMENLRIITFQCVRHCSTRQSLVDPQFCSNAACFCACRSRESEADRAESAHPNADLPLMEEARMPEKRRVRLFRNGRDQAVWIPVEFELPGNEAIIHRDGNRLVIEPVRKRGLLALLKAMKPLNEDFPGIE